MYRPTSNQSSFFEPQFYYSEFLPKGDWSDIFRDKIWPIIDEEKFRHLYREEGGAPNKSIKLKLSLLVFMSWEQLTWRGAEFMFQRRLDWINATCSQLGGRRSTTRRFSNSTGHLRKTRLPIGSLRI